MTFVDEGQGNQLVANCSDKDVELLIVYVETENFFESPTQADCEALEASQDGTVLMDSDHALQDTLGIKSNSGAALVDATGHWLSDPDIVDEETKGASYMAAINTLMSEAGCSMFGGFGGGDFGDGF